MFPKNDSIDPTWVTEEIPQFESLLHLIDLSWTRLSAGEHLTCSHRCGRNVADKEVSEGGLHKTIDDLHVDHNNYKRDQQRLKFIKN